MESKQEHINGESKEKLLHEILGKISIMRHGETKYTEQYPDLTELGTEQIRAQGEKLQESIDREHEDLFIASSPSVRARGSADILKQELNEPEARILKSLRSAEIRNYEEALRMINEIIGPEEDMKKMEKAYAHDAQFEERIDVWEPRSQVEKRFFRGLEYITRAFQTYREKHPQNIPHFIGVSHFEFLNHMVRRVFHLENPGADQLNYGEMIEMTIRNIPEDTRHVPIVVTFRGETKEIIFDRDTRSIEIEKEIP